MVKRAGSDKIRFALIGQGGIARRHAEVLRTMPEAELVAICGAADRLSPQWAGIFAGDYYADYASMLARRDIDVVNICTPSGMHADQAVACARAGKHAIVEKPMAISLEQADRMIAAFHEAGLKLSVIFQHRFDPATRQVKRDMDEGKYGRVFMAHAAANWYRTQQYYDSAAWRGTYRWDGGGILMNQAIHTIDLLQYLLGPADQVYAHCALLGHERIEVEDTAAAVIRFRSGALGTVAATTCAYPNLSARLELFAELGTAVIDRNELVFNAFKREEAIAVNRSFVLQGKRLEPDG